MRQSNGWVHFNYIKKKNFISIHVRWLWVCVMLMCVWNVHTIFFSVDGEAKIGVWKMNIRWVCREFFFSCDVSLEERDYKSISEQNKFYNPPLTPSYPSVMYIRYSWRGKMSLFDNIVAGLWIMTLVNGNRRGLNTNRTPEES